MIIADEDLKSCPFCGQDAVMFSDYRYETDPSNMWIVYGVMCSNQDCIMHQQQKFYRTEVNARMAWNKRRNSHGKLH